MKRTLLMGLVVLGVVAFAVPAYAQPNESVVAAPGSVHPEQRQLTCPATYCDHPVVGDHALVSVAMPRFRSISTMCLRFDFAGDLLDPGEELLLFSPRRVVAIGNYEELGAGRLSSGEVCLANNFFFGRIIGPFTDGHGSFDAWMSRGSAHIANVTVTITGVLQ